VTQAFCSLEGRTALVTGASKGIGRAIATELSSAGASVVLSYRTGADEAQTLASELGARAVQADVSDPSSAQALVEEAGDVDILVNNAGVYSFGAVDDFTEDDFHRHFNTNVLGLLQSTREALKIFNPEGGSVINVGSAITKINPPTTVVYTATKGAVDAITAVLANELAPRKIRVNSINPGGVETEGTVTAGVIGSDWEKKMIADTPLGRIGQVKDIGPLATFLASPDSGWLTGEHLTASGGMR